jgi:predicted ribosome quality control (RQC) complex YloA/Tae2 family protein
LELQQQLQKINPLDPSSPQFLLNSFSGLSLQNAQQIVQASKLDVDSHSGSLLDAIHERIQKLTNPSSVNPRMSLKPGRYSIFSWGLDEAEDWESFPDVSSMVEAYYRETELLERFSQLQNQLLIQLKRQLQKVKAHLESATNNATDEQLIEQYKRYGDLILTNLNQMQPGQSELICQDIFNDNNQVCIPLNPSLSPSQNSQAYYKRFTKAQDKLKTLEKTRAQDLELISNLEKKLEFAEQAHSLYQLEELASTQTKSSAPYKANKKSTELNKLSVEGWTIYFGCNRLENDYLISHVAAPQDIWMHMLGYPSSHVLIKVPKAKVDPPMPILKQASALAAHFSKVASGSPAQVVYTQCRYLKKLGKPGLVSYEKERTLDVDWTKPVPKI